MQARTMRLLEVLQTLADLALAASDFGVLAVMLEGLSSQEKVVKFGVNMGVVSLYIMIDVFLMV
jgi:hypothetical protein